MAIPLFSRKLFGEWLVGKLQEKKLRQKDLAKASGLDMTLVSRACHGLRCSERVANKLIEALGYEPDQVIRELRTAKPSTDSATSVDSVTPESDLESLCKALQIIGGYVSIEEALKAAIRREILAQEAAKTQTN